MRDLHTWGSAQLAGLVSVHFLRAYKFKVSGGLDGEKVDFGECRFMVKSDILERAEELMVSWSVKQCRDIRRDPSRDPSSHYSL